MELASYAILALVVVASLAGLSRPGIGAALGFLVFAIEQGLASGIPYFVARPALWNLLSAFIVLLLLGSAIVRGSYRLRGFFRPVFVSSLVFVAYFVWACSWGPMPDVQALAMGVGPYVAIQLVLVPLLIQSEPDARAMFEWLVVCGVGIGLLALLHMDAARNAQRLQLGAAGSSGVGMNPMALSEACALAAMVLALWTKSTSNRWWALARWPLIIGCLAVAGLASRGEVFAALAAVTLATLMVPEGGLSQRSFRVISTMLLGAVSLYLVLETAVSTRYSVERLEGDAHVRYFASSTMLSVFGATPESWFRGLGTNYSMMLLGIYPHNQPVQALTEGGILGACLWLAVHGFALRAYLGARSKCTTAPSRFVLRVATALWVYFLVIGLKRGHVLDVWALSAAVVLERCALTLTQVRAKLAPGAAHNVGVSGRPEALASDRLGVRSSRAPEPLRRVETRG